MEKNENTNVKRYMNLNVHSSTVNYWLFIIAIYNSQDTEAAQRPVNR